MPEPVTFIRGLELNLFSHRSLTFHPSVLSFSSFALFFCCLSCSFPQYYQWYIYSGRNITLMPYHTTAYHTNHTISYLTIRCTILYRWPFGETFSKVWLKGGLSCSLRKAFFTLSSSGWSFLMWSLPFLIQPLLAVVSMCRTFSVHLCFCYKFISAHLRWLMSLNMLSRTVCFLLNSVVRRVSFPTLSWTVALSYTVFGSIFGFSPILWHWEEAVGLALIW